MSAPDRRFELVISGAALVLLLLGCAVVLRPFVTSLLWAVVLWLTTAPLHQQVLSLVGERRTVAASIMTAGVASVVLLPIVVVGISLADNAEALTAATQRWLEAGPPPPPEWLGTVPLVGGFLSERWAELAGDTEHLSELAGQFIEPARSFVVASGITITRGVTQLGLSVLIAFFLYRDRVAFGDRFRAAA